MSGSATASRPPWRLGPRPLWLHLSTAAATYAAAAPTAAMVRALQCGTNFPSEFDTMARLAVGELGRLVEGIDRYHSHPYCRDVSEPTPIWQSQGMRLLDYGSVAGRGSAAAGPPLLIVPSLINRHYILDLRARQSFVRYMQAAGFRPFLVCWEDTDPAMSVPLSVDICVAEKLNAAFDVVRLATEQKPVIMGYCLGGLLALALAARRRADTAALALLATPWDFHAESAVTPEVAPLTLAMCEPLLATFGSLPIDAVQTLFYAIDPYRVVNKFHDFATCDPASDKAVAFVSLEDWVNDGLPLSAPVTRTLFGEWYGDNRPLAGDWSVAGAKVNPAKLDLPTLVVVPERDRIVSPASARPLAEAIPAADMLEVDYGHIGMIASKSAPARVWQPIAQWMKNAVAFDG